MSLLLAAVITIGTDLPTNIQILPRSGDPAVQLLFVVNKSDRVLVNGVQLYPKTTVQISWTPAAFIWAPDIGAVQSTDEPPTVGYIVRYAPSVILPDGTCPECKERLVPAPATSTTFIGLDSSKDYAFVVIAVDAAGNQSQASPMVIKRPGP